uniref:Uncharacterized protein n=1 Tax=Opuntia streptacantha TaxID=393608 RepID=A0A7C9E7X1_OPUST
MYLIFRSFERAADWRLAKILLARFGSASAISANFSLSIIFFNSAPVNSPLPNSKLKPLEFSPGFFRDSCAIPVLGEGGSFGDSSPKFILPMKLSMEMLL